MKSKNGELVSKVAKETVIIRGMATTLLWVFVPVLIILYAGILFTIITGSFTKTCMGLAIVIVPSIFVAFMLSPKSFKIDNQIIEYRIWQHIWFKVRISEIVAVRTRIISSWLELKIVTKRKDLLIRDDFHMHWKEIREIGAALSTHIDFSKIRVKDSARILNTDVKHTGNRWLIRQSR